MPMSNPDLKKNLAWEATAVLIATLLGLPLAMISFGYLFLSHGYMSRAFGLIAAGLTLPLFIWGAFAVRSRIRKGKDAGEALWEFLKRALIGLAWLVATIAIFTAMAQWTSSRLGFYIIPGGVLLAAILVLVKAMTPPASTEED